MQKKIKNKVGTLAVLFLSLISSPAMCSECKEKRISSSPETSENQKKARVDEAGKKVLIISPLKAFAKSPPQKSPQKVLEEENAQKLLKKGEALRARQKNFMAAMAEAEQECEVQLSENSPQIASRIFPTMLWPHMKDVGRLLSTFMCGKKSYAVIEAMSPARSAHRTIQIHDEEGKAIGMFMLTQGVLGCIDACATANDFYVAVIHNEIVYLWKSSDTVVHSLGKKAINVRIFCHENKVYLAIVRQDGTVGLYNSDGALYKLEHSAFDALSSVRVLTIGAIGEKHLLIAGSQDGIIRLKDVLNGRSLQTFVGHEGSAVSWIGAFNKDEQHIALVSRAQDGLKIWDDAGKLVRAIPATDDRTMCTVKVGAGQYIITSDPKNGCFHVWSTLTGELKAVLLRPDTAFSAQSQLYAFNKDSKELVIAEFNGKMYQWDLSLH